MIVALIGLLASIGAIAIAFPDPARRRVDIYGVVLAMHLAATAAYWLIAEDAGYDAMFYYSDPLGWAHNPVQTGSVMIIQLVQGMRALFGGSFFSYFLFFQAFGMIGCALIIRTLGEIADSFDVEVPNHYYAVLLLPGIHLWTVAIGKDGLLFLAVSLSVWASLHISRRMAWLGLALLIMGLIRPPVALVAIVSLVANLVFDRRLTIGPKIAVGAAVLTGLALVFASVQSSLEIRTLDSQGIADFVERSRSIGQEVAGGADIVNLPYPAKVLSLLFRPLFYDAGGIFGLLASVENVVVILIFFYLGTNARMIAMLVPRVLYLSYCVVFATALYATIALINYNVGLGLRQKTMGMPAILVILVSVALYRRYLATGSERTASPSPARQ